MSAFPGGLRALQHQSLAERTTLRAGGACEWLVEVERSEQLDQVYQWARRENLPVLFLGEGSNVLFSDLGFRGLILRNRMGGRERCGNEVRVGGGENLGKLISWLNDQQLAGLERMYGIPGTVAGAVVGNAGAYGQEIEDTVVEILVWTAEGVRSLSPQEAQFRYRHSVFKERREWFILTCTLRLHPGSDNLRKISEEILLKRLVKYPAGLRCPGSFFKNIVAAELSRQSLQAIPSDFIQFGKIPAGKLLEAMGAKGARQGDAKIADHHANLLINCGGARSADLLQLANEYAGRVLERFGIRLEPEILIVDQRTWPHLQNQPGMANWNHLPGKDGRVSST